jgi:S-adenosylmethionine:diacylglycerol 3-amino-3-carboxypropyl transferase
VRLGTNVHSRTGWTYLQDRSKELAGRDRSSIHGGFRLLVRDG